MIITKFKVKIPMASAVSNKKIFTKFKDGIFFNKFKEFNGGISLLNLNNLKVKFPQINLVLQKRSLLIGK